MDGIQTYSTDFSESTISLALVIDLLLSPKADTVLAKYVLFANVVLV